jgi:hypothetical protein
MGQAMDPPGRVVTTLGRHREPMPTRPVSAGRTAALHVERRAEVEFDDFGWGAITEQARRERVSIEELLVHAAMYYLADADRQRFSHRVPWGRRSQDPSGSADEVRRRL